MEVVSIAGVQQFVGCHPVRESLSALGNDGCDGLQKEKEYLNTILVKIDYKLTHSCKIIQSHVFFKWSYLLVLDMQTKII